MKIAATLASMLALGLAMPASAQRMNPEQSSKVPDCRFGCLVLVNDSENSDIVGLFIHEGFMDPHGRQKVQQRENLFRPQVPIDAAPFGQDFRLYPHKAWWTPLPQGVTCQIRISVSFRDRKTRRVRTGPEGNVNICGGPRTDVVFRAKEAPSGVTG